MFELSVVLCTHDPRRDIIARTLEALKRQSLAPNGWEFLVVDSCSQPPLRGWIDLSWSPHARLIEEVEPGANAARLAAFRQCRSAVLVIVDDDNFLEGDYLEKALAVARRWPQLGAWGGSNIGEFEEPAPDWMRGILHQLAIREVTKEVWTNAETEYRFLPFGAGMCVRRAVVERYQREVAVHPLKQCLGRRGGYNIAGEDPDIACTAFDLGLGVGLFPELKMQHYVPSARMQMRQVLQTVQGNHAGSILLKYLRGQLDLPRSDLIHRARTLLNRYRMSRSQRRFDRVCLQGEKAVWRAIHAFERGEIGTPEEFRSCYLRHLGSTGDAHRWPAANSV